MARPHRGILGSIHVYAEVFEASVCVHFCSLYRLEYYSQDSKKKNTYLSSTYLSRTIDSQHSAQLISSAVSDAEIM
jgi:hypothetical protein